MKTRRQFLGNVVNAIPAGAGLAMLEPLGARQALEAIASYHAPPDEAARDESFWFEVQRAFTVDRSLINLNNGGVSPSPAFVLEAMKRHLDFSNLAPAHTMWNILEPQREGVRQHLASVAGCDAEEIALTRNASEGLEICQLGMDLKRGDEVLTTTQDYPRMITTFQQRERRDGIVLKMIPVPVPCEDHVLLVSLFEENITPRTRVMLISHMINITGQIMPVKEVVQLGRKKNIPVIVDGAHSFAHFAFSLSDLGCDYFCTSLHKWLFAPIGTGMLYVRKERIKDLWPMMPAEEKNADNIRKFEEIGTHPAANYLAIAEAITFHQGIGAKHKEARMIHLRNLWAQRLVKHDRIRLQTSLTDGFACGLATVEIREVDSEALAKHLWEKHHIIVVPIKHPEVNGIRVTPSVYTTPEEIDRFASAMENVLKNGLPKS